MVHCGALCNASEQNPEQVSGRSSSYSNQRAGNKAARAANNNQQPALLLDDAFITKV